MAIRKNQRALIALGAAAALVATAIIVVVSQSGGDSSPDANSSTTSSVVISEQPNEPPRTPTSRDVAGLTATLQPLVPGATFTTVGMSTSLVVSSTGHDGIAAVELWAGAELVASAKQRLGEQVWEGVLDFTPTRVGQIVFSVRATDVVGRSAASNVIVIEALEALVPDALAAHVVTANDTASSLAGLGGPAEEYIDPATLTEGSMLDLRQPMPDLAARPDPEAPPPTEPETLQAESPAITMSDDACTATVSYPLGAVDTVGLVRSGSSGGSFVPVQHAADISDNVVTFANVPLSPGPQLVAIESATNGVWSVSPPAEATGGEGCGGSWTGDLSIRSGELSGVPSDIERVFLFITTGGIWERVPALGQTTIARSGDTFVLDDVLPDLSTAIDVEIEVWGWRDDKLVSLGRSQFSPDAGFRLITIIGTSAATTLKISGPSSPPQQTQDSDPNSAVDFEWSTNIADVTHGLWQVLTHAPGTATSPSTAGVIAEGRLAGNGGSFSLDINEIRRQPPAQRLITSQALAYAALAAAEPLGEPGAANPEEQFDPVTLPAALLASLNAPKIGGLFVRVVPMIGDHWSGTSTNSVIVRPAAPELSELAAAIEEASAPIDPTQRPYEIAATVIAPVPPNVAYTNCWRFNGWNEELRAPFDSPSYDTWNFIMDGLGYDTDLCAHVCYGFGSTTVAFAGRDCSSESPLTEAIRQFGEGLATFWDVVVDAFNAIKSAAVDIVSTLSGCKAIAGLAMDDADADIACDTLGTVVVNGALVYFGIPPSLPNTEELREIAKGELKVLLVELAEQYGVPCDEIGSATDVADLEEYSCEGLAGSIVEEAEAQILDYFRTAASQLSGIDFPAGAIITPSPRGQISPATITFETTPTKGAPQIGGRSCVALATVSAKWEPADSAGSLADLVSAALLRPNASATKLPDWSGYTSKWAVPNNTYEGFVGYSGVVDLQTDDLAYDASAGSGQATAITSFTFTPIDHGVIEAIQFEAIGGFPFENPAPLPASVLHLHRDATFTAEIFSGCTGRYTTEFQLDGGRQNITFVEAT